MLIELEKILEDLKNICLCPECGNEIGCHSHFCEKCKERVSVPLDGIWWFEYLKDKYLI